MPEVLIDGIAYVPKGDIPPLTDARLQSCLKVLVSMRYFDQRHKMDALAHEAIHALAPEFASLPVDVAYQRLHPQE